MDLYDDGDEDRAIKVLYNEPMHKEPIEGNNDIILETEDPQKRAITKGAVIIICSMIGVVPIEKQKIFPCAVKEAWVDPRNLDLTKAKEKIKENIRNQFQLLFPMKGRHNERARKSIKIEMDCSSDVVLKQCDQIRRLIRDDRAIFHYNGHGTMSCNHPKSDYGRSIWMVNRSQSSYTTLQLSHIMDHLKAPAVYIWDCDNAGLIVKRFNEIAHERRDAWENSDQLMPEPKFGECLHLAACAADQELPQNPEMPADLYTSCLTTSVQTALNFWFHQQKCNKIQILDVVEYLDRIDGEMSVRNTMKGELEWILTAILDCMAWQLSYPDHYRFKSLFRHDRPVSCLFRGHILADRIMRAYRVTPVTHPAFPSSAGHPLWRSWDLAVDSIMVELSMRVVHKKPATNRQISTFFFDQLTEFKVGLQYGKYDSVDSKQLPILLQMLMAQQYREETLELIGKFLDRGPYAVRKFITVGLLIYIQRLIQNPMAEFKYIMVLIWAKVLATDRTKTTSEMIIKDPASRGYFLTMLTDNDMSTQTRSMACFCLSVLVKQTQYNQEVLMGENLISKLKYCLEELAPGCNKATKLQKCAVLCLGYMWDRNEKPLWQAVRANAYEEVIKLLDHFHPETRAAAVYSLGTFLYTRTKESEHGASIEHMIANRLLKACDDGSLLVRKEAVVALSRYVQQYEQCFLVAATTLAEELREAKGPKTSLCEDDELGSSPTLEPRRKNISIRTSLLSPPRLPGNKFVDTWRCLKALERDPHRSIRSLATVVIQFIEQQLYRLNSYRKSSETTFGSDSSPELRGNSPGQSLHLSMLDMPNTHIVYSSQYSSKRTMFGKGPKSDDEEEKPPVALEERPKLLVTTDFAEWCEASFAKPLVHKREESDPNSEIFAENQMRILENFKLKQNARATLSKRGHEKLDSQICCIKNHLRPIRVNFHPFEPYIYILDDQYCSLWDYECTQKVHTFECCGRRGKTKDAIILNPHFRPLLCVANNDAEVFIWRNFQDPQSNTLATAFRAFGDVPNKKIPLVLNYAEMKNNLVVSGQAKKMACWNLIKEIRLQDIQTQTDMPLTSMASYDRMPENHNTQENLLLAGFYDGICRLFDLRNPPHEQIVQKFGGDGITQKPVINVHVKPHSDHKIIYTSHSSGDMCFWDLRKSEYNRDRYQLLTDSPRSIKVVNTALKAVAFHNYAPVMACGSHEQYIRIMNNWGDRLNEIKFHDGFMGQRVGPIVSLAFHPFQYKLVSAGMDNVVSVYGKSSQPQSRY